MGTPVILEEVVIAPSDRYNVTDFDPGRPLILILSGGYVLTDSWASLGAGEQLCNR
ncbi:hypothetical protein PL9631_1060121 [Planktothrix paucivesiculata PCC 9631]|uniref:Uncharacterized protein n=1 Tax=Planktothrix paucivesiculata PCC 9631 TaxID=671071 RepID=A0A7Z9BIK5_9CYAN|nr:hypothetical protein PL9631_1060121 [Planktothrix paucivesiculata PCC 9631]